MQPCLFPASLARRLAAPALVLFATTLVPAAVASAQPAGAQPQAKPAMLPARQLTCTLGHVTNYDGTGDQTADQLKYDTHHEFGLYLPSIPVRTAPPPDPADPAEPVDPRTRVTSDPSGLVANAPGPFTRVVDMWPDRVEMSKRVEATSTWDLVMITHADPATHQAQILVTEARDMFAFNKAGIYVGTCQVTEK